MNVCLENFGPYWTSASDQSAAEGLINLKKKSRFRQLGPLVSLPLSCRCVI